MTFTTRNKLADGNITVTKLSLFLVSRGMLLNLSTSDLENFIGSDVESRQTHTWSNRTGEE